MTRNDIPGWVRSAVDERDGLVCRVCGRYQGVGRQIHHIEFGGDKVGMGGRRVHEVDALITTCQRCHSWMHDRKDRARFALMAIQTPGATALQVMRWEQRRSSVSPSAD